MGYQKNTIDLSRLKYVVYGWHNEEKCWFVVVASEVLQFMIKKEKPTVTNDNTPLNGFSKRLFGSVVYLRGIKTPLSYSDCQLDQWKRVVRDG